MTDQSYALLEKFFRRLAEDNPFVVNRVLPADAAAADADAVHRPAFERLLELAQTTHIQQIGLGVVLWGVAGVGKSHVLARLARWAKVRRAPFTLLQNLQAAPEHLPGYVRKVI